MLEGKKTYILVLVALVYAVSAFFTDNISGETAVQEIWTALTVAGLRNAVK